MSTQPENSIPPVGKLISVVPVGLKEAALDSPTFRATTLHFVDQVDVLEKWLDGYSKATTKLAAELSTIDGAIGNYLSFTAGPPSVSEAAVDHDYALLAVRRCGDTFRDVWAALAGATRKLDTLVTEPIKTFINGDLKNFKEVRRALDQSQRQYDHLHSRFLSHSKSKEPSSLREDAFHLHEARKVYLRASLDFSVQAPQLRNVLDRLLARVSCDQWREFKTFHDYNGGIIGKCVHEMDRVRGWVHEIDGTERASRRELISTRKQIEDAAEYASRPSRELDDYSISTVPYLGAQPPPTLDSIRGVKPEKQGWLGLRTLSAKTSRTIWIRRWAFLKNGIFGFLVLGSRTRGVEESERLGVLLCNIRPAFQEERRFCFEVKTKNKTLVLQTETQKELMDWIASFEAAKQKALESPASTDLSISGKFKVQDPAFSISQPPAPEFGTGPADSLTSLSNDEQSSLESSGSLNVPDSDALPSRVSSDISNSRRFTGTDSEHSAREHASRITKKFDLHRKNSGRGSPPLQNAAGGLANLISASHNILPVGPMSIAGLEDWNRGRSMDREGPGNSLAPPTLVNPPAPTTMSKTAILVSDERGIGLGSADSTGGMPSGMMANIWGSSNWGFVNRVEREGPPPLATIPTRSSTSGNRPSSPSVDSVRSRRQQTPGPRHRQTLSVDGDVHRVQVPNSVETSHEYPSYYPQRLRMHGAQFRLLFPDVTNEETLVMVFRTTWNPNDQQEFPGRIYVTTRNMYCYSHYLGLVLTTVIPLNCVTDVTAAPGRDCDFLFLHTLPPRGSDMPGRITFKTFLEPLRLLQKRIRFLIKESTTSEPLSLEALFKALIKMENDQRARSSSSDSLEDPVVQPPADGEVTDNGNPVGRPDKGVRVPIYVDKDLDFSKSGRRRDVPKFRLPAQPVEYVPHGNLNLATEKVLDISPKALFHVLFGDKSAVWQLLLYQRRAREIKQGPWASTESRLFRRDLQYLIDTTDIIGRTQTNTISDYQVIDVFNDHLCYVVTDKRTAWHLPFRRSFMLVSKVVITFVSKSRSKLAMYSKVEWLRPRPRVFTNIIDRQATNDLEQDAMDLVDLVSDQVRRLGAHSRTKKAVSIFGHVGRQKQVSEFSGVGINVKLEPHKLRIQRTLTQLVLEVFFSYMESFISTVVLGTFAVSRWAWKTTSAHKVILALLLSSVLFNTLYTTRDASDWWQERKARNFMAHLGINADNVMSKAIYMRDIDDAIANSTVLRTDGVNSSDCFSTFHEQAVQQQNNGMAFTLAASNPKSAVTKSSMRRFQQTRERLGMYRHDLIVALRVVNSIERELVQNEWERWLREELRRCQQVEALLKADVREEEDEAENQLPLSVFAERTEEVRRWHDVYCTSCRLEEEQVVRSHDGHGIVQPLAMYKG